MTLHDIAHQIHGLAVDSIINGEKFTEKRLKTQLAAMLRKDNDQYIFEIVLPDGTWFAKASRIRGDIYDYYIPDNRAQERRLKAELFR